MIFLPVLTVPASIVRSRGPVYPLNESARSLALLQRGSGPDAQTSCRQATFHAPKLL